jgi:hypothetical protein
VFELSGVSVGVLGFDVLGTKGLRDLGIEVSLRLEFGLLVFGGFLATALGDEDRAAEVGGPAVGAVPESFAAGHAFARGQAIGTP